MPFLAYFAVLLIAVASAAFGLDLLTAPLPDAKPKAQIARNSAPNAVRQIPIGRATANANAADDADRALSPIYPANPAKSHAASLPVQPQAEPAPVPPPNAPAVHAAAVNTPAAPTIAVNTPAQQTAAVNPAAVQNSCDVQACASAYKSFRESDCSYQPLSGERRLCAMPSGQQNRIAAQPQAPRTDFNARNRKEAELRDVERRVRALTARAMDDDYDGRRASGVVVIDMRDGGYAPPDSYSRRWQSWR